MKLVYVFLFLLALILNVGFVACNSGFETFSSLESSSIVNDQLIGDSPHFISHLNTAANDSSGLYNNSECRTSFTGNVKDLNISIDGPLKSVWSHKRKIEPMNLPDAPASAYKDKQGQVSLLISHHVTYRITGKSLNELNQNSTELVFRSNSNKSEDAHDYHHWLFAPYTQDGVNFWGLNHHEWYACLVNNDCGNNFQINMNSWANSITKVASNNGGKSWFIPFSNHVVIAPKPWNGKPYLSVMNNHGYFHPSRMIREGNYLYTFVYYENDATDVPLEKVKAGIMVLRTKDFQNWEYWAGRNKYIPVSQGGTPATISFTNPTALVSVTYNTYLCKYLMVFWKPESDQTKGLGSAYYSLSSSLLSQNWSSPQKIIGSESLIVPYNGGRGLRVQNYLSILDSKSKGYNFEFSSERPDLYINTIGDIEGQLFTQKPINLRQLGGA